MTSYTVEVDSVDMSAYLQRIEFWTKPLPFGIGRFQLTLDNSSGDLSNYFSADDPVLIKAGTLSAFGGYVDIPNPQVSDVLEAHFMRSIQLSGRDYGQDLMNKSIDYSLNEQAELIINTLLVLTSSEITFISSPSPVIYHDSKGWSYLIDQFRTIHELIDYEGYVDPLKVFHMFPIGTKASGITLKSIANDPTNNIIKLLDHVESDSVESRNVILAFGPEVDDHYTELNASGFAALHVGNTISDSDGSPDTTPRKGLAAIKVTRGAAANTGCKLVFPKYFLYYLDFSKSTSSSIEFQHFWLYTGGGATITMRVTLVDSAGNTIHKDANYVAPPASNWAKITLPIGSENIGSWTFDVGATFDWKVTEIWFDCQTLAAISYILIDALKMPIEIVACANHSGGVCQICSVNFPATMAKHLPLSKTDVACQMELEAYAESIADKRMYPLERLHLIADGEAGIIGGTPAWMWLPGYNVTVNVPDAEINSEVFRMVDLHHVITRPLSTDPIHTVELQLLPYNQVVDSQRWSYGKDGKIALIRRLHDRLRWLESRKGYVP